jgi:hypothetical protein
LVVVDESDDGARYRLLETMRQYAQERLEAAGDVADVRRCHADHYVARAEAAGPLLRSREQLSIARQVTRDIDNLRAAFDWAAETECTDAAMRLVAPLAVYGTVVGYASADWAVTATGLPNALEHPRFSEVGPWAAFAAGWAGDLETARSLADAVESFEATRGHPTAGASTNRAILAFFRGELDEGARHAGAAVELARETNDPYELTSALAAMGVVLGYNSDPAIASLEEAVQIAREAGIATSLSFGLLTLAVALPLDEVPRKMALLDEAVEVATSIGDRDSVHSSIAYRALLEAHSGNWRAALRLSADAVHEKRFALHPSLWAAAVALLGLGQAESAAVLVGAADSTGPPGIRRPLEDWGIAMAGSTDAALLAELGEERLAELRLRGAALDPVDVVAFLCAEADRVLDSVDR